MRYLKLPIAYLLLAAVWVIVGCGGGNMRSGGVKDAKGETPVKYVLCKWREQNCFVAARFSDLESCENYKKWSAMDCDSQSKSGRILCTPIFQGDVGAAYCTP
jgi:hypothetical protein